MGICTSLNETVDATTDAIKKAGNTLQEAANNLNTTNAMLGDCHATAGRLARAMPATPAPNAHRGPPRRGPPPARPRANSYSSTPPPVRPARVAPANKTLDKCIDDETRVYMKVKGGDSSILGHYVYLKVSTEDNPYYSVGFTNDPKAYPPIPWLVSREGEHLQFTSDDANMALSYKGNNHRCCLIDEICKWKMHKTGVMECRYDGNGYAHYIHESISNKKTYYLYLTSNRDSALTFTLEDSKTKRTVDITKNY